jgi:hypothetical protein
VPATDDPAVQKNLAIYPRSFPFATVEEVSSMDPAVQ